MEGGLGVEALGGGVTVWWPGMGEGCCFLRFVGAAARLLFLWLEVVAGALEIRAREWLSDDRVWAGALGLAREL